MLDVDWFPSSISLMRILTGIKPTGIPHLGNYFGAIKPAVEAQDKGEAFYFIADYHSMTSLFDPKARREYTLGVALDWLACGLDPQRAVFFVQSDVPEVTELAWIVGTMAPMSRLELAHAYKDALAKGQAPSYGLFAYPVLMAADILLYDSNIVPVGRDQKQHVEITRDLAIKFNQTYGETFVIPEPQIRDDTAVIPGLDGQKMSKSYGNTIEIFGDEKTMRKKIMAIVMDSRSPGEPKPDANKNLAIQLLTVIDASIGSEYENKLRAGGLGYGDLKKKLFEVYWEHFAAARKKRAELAANLDSVNQVLADGATKARTKAREVLKRAREAAGLE